MKQEGREFGQRQSVSVRHAGIVRDAFALRGRGIIQPGLVLVSIVRGLLVYGLLN